MASALSSASLQLYHLIKAWAKQECRLVSIQSQSNPFSSLSHNVSLPVTQTALHNSSIYQPNEDLLDVSFSSKKIAPARLFMTAIWNLNCFDFWGSLNGPFFDVYKGRDCFILLQTMQSFFLSRSVWIVIENNYPVLCSDNAHLLHQLNHVRHYLQYPFTKAPNQPEQLHKFPSSGGCAYLS